MTRRQKIAKARKLRDAGWTLKSIAGILETNPTTVGRWLNPEQAEKAKASSRAWKDRNRKLNRERDALRKAHPPRPKAVLPQKGRIKTKAGMALTLKNEGMTEEEIAYELGTTAVKVRDMIR